MYVFHPDADELDVINQLQARLSQLSAMLSFTYGESREDFDRMGDEVRDNFMWGCASAAYECGDLVSHLDKIASQQRRVNAGRA